MPTNEAGASEVAPQQGRSPLNIAVVESLMRAHLANYDRAGAEKVDKEHAAALDQAQLGDPADSIEDLRLGVHLK